MSQSPVRRTASRPGRRWRVASVVAAAYLGLVTASTSLAATPAPSGPGAPRSGIGHEVPITRSTWAAAVRAAQADPARSARSGRTMPFRTLPSALLRPTPARPTIGPKPMTPRPAVRTAGATTPAVAAPSPALVTTYDGISEAEAGPLEPPDPWVQASPSYVIATTNGRVRVSDRHGSTLQSVPTWALFGVPVDQTEADPRILWDTFHQRWVGVVVTFADDFSQDFLSVIVSEGTSPLGAWDHILFDSGSVLADFPGIASSSDKIVIGANAFNEIGDFLGGQLFEIAWSQILLGGSVDFHQSLPDPAIAHPRPAQVIGTSPDVHVVAEDTVGGHLLYRRLAGSATDRLTGLAQYTDLDGDAGNVNGPFALPPAPNQPGSPATIVDAVDERPTDAVWRGGALWLVATFPHDFGMGDLDTVRIVRISTTSGPAVTFDGLIGGAGHDTYMGGIGVLADGTAVISYEMSSPVLPIRSAVTTWNDTDGLGTELVLGDSAGTYDGTRWGDFQAVAADPSGGQSAWVVGETAAADGTWRTHVARLTYDATAPGTPGVPAVVVVAPGTLSDSVPVRLSWAAALDAGSGIDHYAVEKSRDGGPFELPSTTTSTSLIEPFLVGHTTRCRVQATDGAGNTGLFATGATVTTSVRQQTSATTYSGSWHTVSSTSYSGGTARYASTAGASATFIFYGRSVGFVTYKASTRGSLKIYIDNVYKGTISLSSSTSRARQIVYATSWASPGTHRLKVVVVGTAGHPRVDVDAFVVLN